MVLTGRAALIGLALSFYAWAAQGSVPTPPIKVMRVNLDDFGWQFPPKCAWGECDIVADDHRVAIDSQGRVLVGFATRDSSEGLVTRANPGWHFHVLRFAKSGELDLSFQVPTNGYWPNGLYLSDRDAIIVRANDSLQLATPARSGSGDKVSLRILAPCGPHCVVVQSPSRRSLYFASEYRGTVATILDTRSGAIKRCRPADDAFTGQMYISDDFAYWNHDKGNPPMPPPILYRWPLCEPELRSVLPISEHRLIALFEDGGSLIFFSPPSRPDKPPCGLFVYGVGGNLEDKLSLPLGKHEHPEGVAICQTNKRIAVDVSTWRGGMSWLDISPHVTAERVVVLGVPDGKTLASFPVSPPSVSYIAMSPDGHRVAALFWQHLTIADVP